MTDLSTTNLKHLLDKATPGPWEAEDAVHPEHIRAKHGLVLWNPEQGFGWSREDQDVHLAAAAPELAQEVVRLRTGVERLLEMCLLERDAAFQDSPMRAGEVAAFNLCAERLTDLLAGDHDE